VPSGLLHRHDLEKARAITAADLMTAPAVTVGPDDLVSRDRLRYPHDEHVPSPGPVF
jgi:hypothetical protein